MFVSNLVRKFLPPCRRRVVVAAAAVWAAESRLPDSVNQFFSKVSLTLQIVLGKNAILDILNPNANW